MSDNNRDVGGLIILFIIIIGVGGGIQSLVTTTYVYESTEYEIYKATVPFGVFMVEGNMGGVMFMGTGMISGSISSEETYFLKYFDGDELKSISFDAEDVSIVVDGTFVLEEIIPVAKSTWLFWDNSDPHTWSKEHKIHIPYLPTVNRTLTEDWQITR